jgi:hypothetical protein
MTGVGVLVALDAVRAWIVPGIATAVVAVSAVLAQLRLLPVDVALATVVLALLVLLLAIALRPLLTRSATAQPPRLGGAVAVLWLAVCYAPFHARLFPGIPLVAAAQVTASGSGLPLRIPAAGHAAVDLLLEGKLNPNPTGGVAPPVNFRMTVTAGDGTSRVVAGTFEDTLRTQRLGRRGTAVVHQTHTADVRVLSNPGRQDLTVTQLALEPTSAQPITVSAFVHPLPGPVVLALVALALAGAVAAFDRLGPVPETDGALTLSTLAVGGAAIVFWTSNAVHPDFSTLIGSAIFGGPLGFAAGAFVWWIAKRLIVRPAA